MKTSKSVTMPEFNVKTYFSKCDGETDIRRFSYASKEGITYDGLVEQFRTTYNIPEQCGIKLFWKDNDGDLLTIADTKEFTSILSSCEELIKLVVRVRDPEPEPVDPTLHQGVSCDGCSSSVRGIRFKCLVCPDYDLCCDCERKDMHQDHLMLKIARPNTAEVQPMVFLANLLRQGDNASEAGNCRGKMPNFSDLGPFMDNLSQMLGGGFASRNCPPRTASSGQRHPFWAQGCSNQARSENRVSETLKQLRAMGFPDINGDLEKLVRSHNGDLMAVLDGLKA